MKERKKNINDILARFKLHTPFIIEDEMTRKNLR